MIYLSVSFREEFGQGHLDLRYARLREAQRYYGTPFQCNF